MRTLAGAIALATPLFARTFVFEGRYWLADAVNRARIDAPQLNTEIDFERDLGVEDHNPFDFAVAARPSPRHRIRFGFTRMSWNGDQNVVRTIEFANRTYTIGTRVVSSLDLNHARLGWSWQFIQAADGRFRLGPLVEGHGLWFDASIEAPELRLRAAEKREVGYPAVGFALDAAPHPLVALFAEASGISLGDYGYTYGGEAGGRIGPVPHLGVTAGYRLFRVDPKFDPDYARVKVSGPFVGIAISF